MQFKVPASELKEIGLEPNTEDGTGKYYIGRINFIGHLIGIMEFIGW